MSFNHSADPSVYKERSRGRTMQCPECGLWRNSRAAECFHCRTEKICIGCGVVKPLDDFTTSKTSGDGRSGRCKKCTQAEQGVRSLVPVADRPRHKSRGRNTYCPTCDGYYNWRAKTCPYCRTEKECAVCGLVKSLDGGFYPHPPSVDGHNSRCIQCFRERLHIWQTYGITYETYMQMLDEQGGVCAICGSDNNGIRLHVDHDHATNEVRGLLCILCNQGLGSFRDETEFLHLAISYLERAAA